MTAVADGDLLHGCRRVGHVVVLGQRSERERKSTAGRHLFDCQRVPARREDPVVPAEHETSRALEVGREVRALVWGVWCGTPCVSISPRFRVVMLLLGRPKSRTPRMRWMIFLLRLWVRSNCRQTGEQSIYSQ